jgi:hypothetical protein
MLIRVIHIITGDKTPFSFKEFYHYPLVEDSC